MLCVVFFSLISFTFFLTYIWIRNRARECLAVVCTCEILMSCAKPSSALTKCTSQSREVYISKYSERVFLCAQIKPQNKKKVLSSEEISRIHGFLLRKKKTAAWWVMWISYFFSLSVFYQRLPVCRRHVGLWLNHTKPVQMSVKLDQLSRLIRLAAARHNLSDWSLVSN